MKAIVKREARESIWLEDVPEPELGIFEVEITDQVQGLSLFLETTRRGRGVISDQGTRVFQIAE